LDLLEEQQHVLDVGRKADDPRKQFGRADRLEALCGREHVGSLDLPEQVTAHAAMDRLAHTVQQQVFVGVDFQSQIFAIFAQEPEVIAKYGDFLLRERLVRVLFEIDGFGRLRQYPCSAIRGSPSTAAAPTPAAALAVGLALARPVRGLAFRRLLALLVRGLAVGRPRTSPSRPAPPFRATAIRRFRPLRRIHRSILPNAVNL